MDEWRTAQEAVEELSPREGQGGALGPRSPTGRFLVGALGLYLLMAFYFFFWTAWYQYLDFPTVRCFTFPEWQGCMQYDHWWLYDLIYYAAAGGGIGLMIVACVDRRQLVTETDISSF
jgi:hypothetical protein